MPETVPMVPVHPLKAFALLSIDLAKNSVGLLVKKSVRDKSKVKTEYESGSWKNFLDEKSWLRKKSLEDLVTLTDNKSYRIAKIDNDIIKIRNNDYYAYRREILREIVSSYWLPETPLTEIGCGWGMNLFSLYSATNPQKMFGCDISLNAIRAGQAIRDHFKLKNIEFYNLDLVGDSKETLERMRGHTVLTYYCLEQLKHHTRQVIENLIGSGCKRVIHIEPTYEKPSFSSLKDLCSYLYVVRKDYQDNLLSTLNNFEKEGRIKIVANKRLYYAPSIRYCPSLVCWEPSLYEK